MKKIAIVYFSGFGHTEKQAQAVCDGVRSVSQSSVSMHRISELGTLPDGSLEKLGASDGIIFGSPTYMGGPAWQFKKFADETSKFWFIQAWKNKLAAGFTNSASMNGDKYSTIQYFWTLSQQHGQVWIGTGLLPANKKGDGPKDLNWCGGFSGAFATSPSDSSCEEAPHSGDLATARHLGKRVALFANCIT